jgi:uncharacterized protein YbjT (DUF2867 family)
MYGLDVLDAPVTTRPTTADLLAAACDLLRAVPISAMPPEWDQEVSRVLELAGDA